ncbi:transcriptional regulator [Wenjunlia vitaminophila]|uniref:Transcriptional regulator n=1 Tax=Wenjunlia vitaminophila TaxID=76728 RepID=A0A0T6LP88_WENVI|nr:hypothetical protein [Wenjunlia vitaminophila]KRV47800.1 transcriptional regulator [Wenjunlia vitaminophila]
MTSSTDRRPTPNTTFRALRGALSPGEFASQVRRAAREIGEQVSCDARYIGRVESGEIQCPNYAYERVFRHMFPGRTLRDLGFVPRELVRGRRTAAELCLVNPASGGVRPGTLRPWLIDVEDGAPRQDAPDAYDPCDFDSCVTDACEGAADELRRAFLAGGPPEHAVQQVVRQIRLLDDQHGADAFYGRAGRSLHTAYRLLEEGAHSRRAASRLHVETGELALSVGWLAHDSLRPDQARSYYSEALATAQLTGDRGLGAHAFCLTAFLARDLGRYREAVHAARAGQHAARHLASPRLLALLALREAGGLAGLGDRAGCEQSLARAERLFAKGPRDADPEWMCFFGRAELAGLEAQCWSRLGDFARAADRARRAVDLQPCHFARNIALFTAELAHDLTGRGEIIEAVHHCYRVLELLRRQVDSARIRAMLVTTVRALRAHQSVPDVAAFLEAYQAYRQERALPVASV